MPLKHRWIMDFQWLVFKLSCTETFMTVNLTVFRFLFFILSITILVSLRGQYEYTDTSQGVGLAQVVLYFFIGIIAATIANSTGAGGGIVFLPIFMGLGFSAAESLSTSIAIQCFGMTSGALSWINYRKKEYKEHANQWRYFYVIFPVSALSSCLGILITQRFMPQPILDIELLFSIFSLIIGSVILLRTLRVTKENDGRIHPLSSAELAGLIFISFIGGTITSWLSIGVGEILLIYLIFLGYRLNVAVAAAVCVSASSVLVALPFHILSDTIRIDVLAYAALGALIGGVIARHLATYLGSHKLKIATSVWIILSALPYLVSSLK